MTINFDASNSNKALLVASGIDGWVIAWGMAPFWLGDNQQGLEGNAQVPPGGFNFENRDGVYLLGYGSNGAILQPVVLPWRGSLYVMNGTGPMDQQANSVKITVVPKC